MAVEHRSRVDASAGVSPTSPAPRRPLAITVGEPAGIGPDLCVLLAQRPPACPLVVVGNADLLSQRARQLQLPLHLVPYTAQQTVTCEPGRLHVWDQALPVAAQPGVLDERNADAVLHWLRTAAAACRAGHFSGMVTAPVHKGIINDAGVPFSGHTEFLAELTGTQTVVMMLAGANLRVALATTHLPLRAVPDAITQASLEATLRVLHRELVQRFRLSAPRILVAGLNPHAGEGGYLGDEEVRVIAPVLERLRQAGMELIGPLPADTLFTPAQLSLADCVLAMYHDQGLPVLKHASFGTAVNVTLGLPIVRTSVDHGTALDRAGTGDIDVGSLYAAVEMAAYLSSSGVAVAETTV